VFWIRSFYERFFDQPTWLPAHGIRWATTGSRGLEVTWINRGLHGSHMGWSERAVQTLKATLEKAVSYLSISYPSTVHTTSNRIWLVWIDARQKVPTPTVPEELFLNAQTSNLLISTKKQIKCDELLNTTKARVQVLSRWWPQTAVQVIEVWWKTVQTRLGPA